MEEYDQTSFDISEDEWVKEVTLLATKFPDKSVFVRVLWSFGDMTATGFRPLVDDRMLHIPLRQQSPSDLRDDAIRICLPELERGHYRKYPSESGEVVLTMYYPVGPPPPDQFDFVEVQIATDAAFQDLVNSTARKQ